MDLVRLVVLGETMNRGDIVCFLNLVVKLIVRVSIKCQLIGQYKQNFIVELMGVELGNSKKNLFIM